jgi:hypothetical protein
MRRFWIILTLAAALGTLSASQALHAAAEVVPPRWRAQWFLPQGTVLPRDQVRPPAVIGFVFGMNPPDGWIVTWTDNVQANGTRLPQEAGETPVRGERQLLFRIDPCKVAGLDTPGTEIGITYEFVFSASQPEGSWTPPITKGSRVLRLAPDTVAPQFLSVRASKTTVHRDETVGIALKSSDESEKLGGNVVWDSGLHEFDLNQVSGPTEPGASGLQNFRIAQTVPQTCTEKANEAEHTFSYTVPHSAQPGDEITLIAGVTDWAGKKSEETIVLKVVGKKPEDTAQADPGPFPPRPACAHVGGATYFYQGIGGTCSGTMVICAESLPIGCPFAGSTAVAHREEGPQVCCDDWKKARQTKKPCDVSQDADCDGIKNADDRDPLRKGNNPPPPSSQRPSSSFSP